MFILLGPKDSLLDVMVCDSKSELQPVLWPRFLQMLVKNCTNTECGSSEKSLAC